MMRAQPRLANLRRGHIHRELKNLERNSGPTTITFIAVLHIKLGKKAEALQIPAN